MDHLRTAPVTPEKWPDLERLFGERGACGGCWCMYWRISRKEYESRKGAGNRAALKRLVESSVVPGLIAYRGDQPVGWCSVAPREDFATLNRSRILKPVDERPVWSIVCLFVAREFRRKGVSVGLIQAASEYAASQGATVVEAYPTEPKKEKMPDVFAFTGLASAFRRAGFREVARRSETRPIMRKEV